MSQMQSAADSDAVLVDIVDGVATLTLNRPEARNTMDLETMRALHAALESTDADDAVRVVVITGSGNTFCSGADLKGATQANDDDKRWNGPSAIVTVLEAMLHHRKPLIARVQGHVAGGGNGLVAACDLAVSVESAKFAYSEVRLGLAPAVISVVCLNKMNVSDGFELFLTGERVSAERMKQAGLLNSVVPDAALDAAVGTWCDQLRQGGPKALAATKQLLHNVRTMPQREAFAWTAEISTELFGSAEAQAGMTAFLNKQKVPWAERAVVISADE